MKKHHVAYHQNQISRDLVSNFNCIVYTNFYFFFFHYLNSSFFYYFCINNICGRERGVYVSTVQSNYEDERGKKRKKKRKLNMKK